MDSNSSLNGRISITPPAGRVWEIQKNRKAGDQQRQNEKKNDQKKKEEDSLHLLTDPDTDQTESTDTEDEIEDYSASGRSKKMKYTLDVKI